MTSSSTHAAQAMAELISRALKIRPIVVHGSQVDIWRVVTSIFLRITFRRLQNHEMTLVYHGEVVSSLRAIGVGVQELAARSHHAAKTIAFAVWSIQNLCGNTFLTYSTYFFQQAGLPTEQSFNITIGQYGIAFFGTVGSWFSVTWFGRRTLYCCGLAFLQMLLIIIGCVAVSGTSEARSWATGSMLLVFVAVYALSTMVLARACYNIFGIVDGVLIPYILNPTAWNWKGKAGFFWAGVNFVCLTWCFFRLPEPKGRAFSELDDLFERKISTRKFTQTEVVI
ncbi:hypothetical protein FDECE_11390 [Fusarium decemcellulare]|nr:hypothetical protein FDECE_11390 [Fusarium decemcellulare]